jgi:hypothetical protein
MPWLPAGRTGGIVSGVSYELCALAGPHEVAAQTAGHAGATEVGLPQGYGLVPITPAVLARLGGTSRPFGDTFLYLSSGVGDLARRVSHTGPIAYLEAEMFGGTGTQAMVVWLHGDVWLGRPSPSSAGRHPDRTPARTGPSTRHCASSA